MGVVMVSRTMVTVTIIWCGGGGGGERGGVGVASGRSGDDVRPGG